MIDKIIAKIIAVVDTIIDLIIPENGFDFNLISIIYHIYKFNV
jgi:hypothetical protein